MKRGRWRKLRGQTGNVELVESIQVGWAGVKVKVEASIARDLYDKIHTIILKEQAFDRDRDWPEVSISNVLEMLLRKGVRAYETETPRAPSVATPRTPATLPKQ